MRAGAPRWRMGVDLGGTKIEVAVLAPGGEAVLRRRVPTPEGYLGILGAIEALVAGAEAESLSRRPAPDGLGGLGGLGIGVPGSIGPVTGTMRNANTTCLNGRRLDRDLTERLRRPVTVENDANAFALAEALSGAGQGAGSVFGVILGTGVGGGVVVDGRLWPGASRIAGEWGHTPLPRPSDEERPGPACYCGRRGCVETWISGPALARDHLAATGVARTGEEIAADAAEGAPAAKASLARHLGRLARALGPVVNILDPEVIVLGGGLANLPGLAERLERALAAEIFSDAPTTRVRRHRLGDSAGVIGAAWLAPPG